jgi:hypothetical protein
MKLLKWSWLGVFALAFVLIACQKDVGSPSEISAAKGGGGGGGGTPPPAFILNIPTFATSCYGEAYCFDASFTNNGGNEPGGVHNSITVSVWSENNTVKVGDDIIVNSTNGNFCLPADLAVGSYTVRVTYAHTPSLNATPQHGTFSFPLTVSDDENCGENICEFEGLNLSRVAAITTTGGFAPLSVDLLLIVSNCGEEDQTGIKLQGGLVSKASLLSTPSTNGDATNIFYDNRTNRGNIVLAWTFDLPAGGVQNFIINYSVSQASCGSPLTGEWSIKKDGVIVGSVSDPSLTQPGYLARLYWLCP